MYIKPWLNNNTLPVAIPTAGSASAKTPVTLEFGFGGVVPSAAGGLLHVLSPVKATP